MGHEGRAPPDQRLSSGHGLAVAAHAPITRPACLDYGVGRYDYERWTSGWQKLFDTHKLVHNNREIKKIVVSREGDGAFAVVDIDTLWIDRKGRPDHWKGRVCKVYSKIGEEWKMTMHTGVLDYS